jgi:hypothetical protein
MTYLLPSELSEAVTLRTFILEVVGWNADYPDCGFMVFLSHSRRMPEYLEIGPVGVDKYRAPGRHGA